MKGTSSYLRAHRLQVVQPPVLVDFDQGRPVREHLRVDRLAVKGFILHLRVDRARSRSYKTDHDLLVELVDHL